MMPVRLSARSLPRDPPVSDLAGRAGGGVVAVLPVTGLLALLILGWVYGLAWFAWDDIRELCARELELDRPFWEDE